MSSGAWSSGAPPVRIELADGRLIRGFIDEGYGAIVDTFRANILERRDLGPPVPSMWPVGWSSISGDGWLIG